MAFSACLWRTKGAYLPMTRYTAKVWGEDSYGDESNAAGCHTRNLREKLYEAEPDAPFTIRCVREEGTALKLIQNEW